MSTIVILSYFFFFQAEDGIRDLTVTGVQTCALPISGRATCLGRVPSRGNVPLGRSRHRPDHRDRRHWRLECALRWLPSVRRRVPHPNPHLGAARRHRHGSWHLSPLRKRSPESPGTRRRFALHPAEFPPPPLARRPLSLRGWEQLCPLPEVLARHGRGPVGFCRGGVGGGVRDRRIAPPDSARTTTRPPRSAAARSVACFGRRRGRLHRTTRVAIGFR